MLWRRKSEGFEWHKYVRTTIKLRRRDRRERIVRAQEAVVGGLKDAGQVAVEGLKDAGQVAFVGLKDAGRVGVEAGSSGLFAAGRLGLVGARRGAAGLQRFAAEVPGVLGAVAAAVLVPAWRWTKARLMPLAAAVDRSGYSQVLLLIGGVLLAIGAVHASSARLDINAIAVIGLAFCLLAVGSLPFSIGPRSWPGSDLVRLLLPGLDALPRPPRNVMAGALVLAVLLASGWLITSRPGMLSFAWLTGGGDKLEGRAIALSGDTIQLRGRTIRLSGIDAPELDQQCGGQGRGRVWRCGEAAQSTLQALLRGQAVKCTTGGSDESGYPVATCHIGEKDVAAEVVRLGHAFAETGAFSTYARLESTARSAKLGLWRAAAERPSEYRAKRWETAKRSAPDGCPIKGHVTSEGRVYSLPWSPDYARIRVREQRGERWFCSELEARAAAWRPVERS
jgi:endonuclease YncB( thermonuclease family)